MTTAHRAITGIDLHVPGYVQSSDPGAVGAGKFWFDTDDDTLYVRDAANAAWDAVGGSAHPDLAAHDALGLATQAELDAIVTAYALATDAELATHAGAADPHPGYLTPAEGNAAYQPLDADLTAIAALASAADQLPYFTGSGAAALATLTAAARTVLDDTTVAAMLATLGGAPLASPTFTGLVTTAGQIAFPATANPSADANTLDDYEEGTFTPAVQYATVGSSSWSVTTQLGWYTKIGNVVNFTLFYSGVPTNGSGSGNVQLTGLPFTTANTTNRNAIGAVTMYGYTKAGFTNIAYSINVNDTKGSLNAMGSGVTAVPLAVADIPTGGTVNIRSGGHFATA